MIIIKQVILITYHEFFNILQLINFILFLKDTGKESRYNFINLWNLDT